MSQPDDRIKKSWGDPLTIHCMLNLLSRNRRVEHAPILVNFTRWLLERYSIPKEYTRYNKKLAHEQLTLKQMVAEKQISERKANEMIAGRIWWETLVQTRRANVCFNRAIEDELMRKLRELIPSPV